MFTIPRIGGLLAVPALAFTLAACAASSNQASDLSTDAVAGKTYAETHCMGCHTIDGRKKAGPTFKGLAGSQVQLESGTTITADEAYLIKSIRQPSADVVKGFPNVMGSAIPEGSISDDQARQLAAYIETLK